VLLLSLNIGRPKDPPTPLGAAYLYAWLVAGPARGEGLQVELLDHNASDDLETIAREILSVNPDIIGIGVYVWNAEPVNKVTGLMRSLGYEGKIVLGGPQITFGGPALPQEFPFADYLVKGEGEVALETIVRAVLKGEEPRGWGIYSRDFSGTSRNPPDWVPVDPYTLPGLFPHLVKEGFARIQYQRGCPHGCSFCAFPFPDHLFREMDIVSLEGQLMALRKEGTRSVAVLDPVFFHDKRRALQMLDTFQRVAPDIRFELQTRVEDLDDVVIGKLATVSVLVEIGIQTMDPIVQREVRRGNSRCKVERTLLLLQNLGVKFEVHLIFGLPYQTLSSFQSDLDSLLAYRPFRIRVFPLNLHRGTRLAEDVRGKYSGMMAFSSNFPMEVTMTAWMSQEEVVILKRMHGLLESGLGEVGTEGGARGLYERCRKAESEPDGRD
jgi:radical SAM superfamily enzyme YgiQ (UPF0313 family)